MRIHKRRIRSVFVPIFLTLLTCAAVSAQKQEAIEGGSITWKGEEFTISADEITRNLKVVNVLNPRTPQADRLHLAWCRAIRLACARLEGIQVEPGQFKEWMRQRHVDLSASVANARDPRAALDAWLKSRGFENLESYEAVCREEYLGELFIEQEFPAVDADSEAVRRRFDEIFTAFEVSVVVFAPETLEGYQPIDRKQPESKALFGSWWNSLSDRQKQSYDDWDHPAVEAETIYFQFDDKSVEQLKEFFEKDRPELGGSLKDKTAHFKISAKDRYKMAARWEQYRRGSMAHWNAFIPVGTGREEAFEAIRPHMERVWRLIRYLGEIWKEIDQSDDPVDMKALARKKGASYRYIPLTPTRLLTADEDLPGDHPLYMRNSADNSLYSYTSMADQIGSIYYANGIVDQPGLHAGVWRKIHNEEMRARPAEEMIDACWGRFEKENRWRLAYDCANRLRDELDRRMRSHLEEAEKGGKLSPDSRRRAEFEFARKNFAIYFDDRAGAVKHAQVLPAFFVRPFEGRSVSPSYAGKLGVRASNYLSMGWGLIAGKNPGSLREGQILPLAVSNERKVAVLVRINKIHPPSENRWKIDGAGRQAARRDLTQLSRIERGRRIDREWAYPNIMQKFGMKAKQYERHMISAMMGKSALNTDKAPRSEQPAGGSDNKKNDGK